MTISKANRIIARYEDRVIGWVGSEKKCRLYGDDEWVARATAASLVGLEFELYNGINLKADIEDYQNPAGAFAAMAWFAKERIDIREAPEGMMESIGLLETPEYFEPLFDVDNATEEEVEFASRHLHLILDGQDVYLPLSKLVEDTRPPLEQLRNFIS